LAGFGLPATAVALENCTCCVTVALLPLKPPLPP